MLHNFPQEAILRHLTREDGNGIDSTPYEYCVRNEGELSTRVRLRASYLHDHLFRGSE